MNRKKMKNILEILYKGKENPKIEVTIIEKNHKKRCDSLIERWIMPPLAVFKHKELNLDSNEINLNKEIFHCYPCARDILLSLETSRSGLIVKNPEVLAELRQKLNSLFL